MSYELREVTPITHHEAVVEEEDPVEGRWRVSLREARGCCGWGATRNNAYRNLIEYFGEMAERAKLAMERRDADDTHAEYCRQCGVECGSACSRHPTAGVNRYKRST